MISCPIEHLTELVQYGVNLWRFHKWTSSPAKTSGVSSAVRYGMYKYPTDFYTWSDFYGHFANICQFKRQAPIEPRMNSRGRFDEVPYALCLPASLGRQGQRSLGRSCAFTPAAVPRPAKIVFAETIWAMSAGDMSSALPMT